MTLRRLVYAIALFSFGPGIASAAHYESANFAVTAPTAELAKKFGDMADFYRREKAIQWLGKEMPPWSRKCPLRVDITMDSAGGATTFTFGSDGGRSVVTSQSMEIKGNVKQLLNSVLPHEITHTVLAQHFGRPVPRWADEGGSVLSENDEERYSHDVRCRELLNGGRGIQLRVLFKIAVALLVLPFAMLAVFIGLTLAFAAVVVAILLPLLPLAFLVFCVWVVVRLASRPSALSV